MEYWKFRGRYAIIVRRGFVTVEDAWLLMLALVRWWMQFVRSASEEYGITEAEYFVVLFAIAFYVKMINSNIKLRAKFWSLKASNVIFILVLYYVIVVIVIIKEFFIQEENKHRFFNIIYLIFVQVNRAINSGNIPAWDVRRAIVKIMFVGKDSSMKRTSQFLVQNVAMKLRKPRILVCRVSWSLVFFFITEANSKHPELADLPKSKDLKTVLPKIYNV